MSEPPASPPSDAAIEPWTVEASRYVVRDRWISLRADDCATRDGVTIAPLYVLEYPDWVQVVAIDEHDQIILVEQYRHGLGAASLELPGGAMDPADAGPLEAAARELAEETGYGAAGLKIIASMSPNPATHDNRVHVVLAQGAARLRTPKLDPAERINVVRQPVEGIVGLLLAGQMAQAIHIASLALALTSIGRWR